MEWLDFLPVSKAAIMQVGAFFSVSASLTYVIPYSLYRLHCANLIEYLLV